MENTANACASLQTLCVGSRESPLALAQTHYVMGLIQSVYPQIELTLKTFKTMGDKFLDAPLAAIGDKGLFVKELEEALLAKEIDFAVHSLKDMLSELPPGLSMQSVSHREDPRDVLLNLESKKLTDLPTGAVVGTASLRRVCQLKALRGDLNYQTVRGNLQTRLKKLQDGQYDAIVLAAAGVKRMGWLEDGAAQRGFVTQYFDPHTEMLPAVGQGILSVEYRSDDVAVQSVLSNLCDTNTQYAMQAERAFLKRLEGGCRLPVAAYAWQDTVGFKLKAAVYDANGLHRLEDSVEFMHSPDSNTAEKAGIQLAERLLDHGAAEFLKNV